MKMEHESIVDRIKDLVNAEEKAPTKPTLAKYKPDPALVEKADDGDDDA